MAALSDKQFMVGAGAVLVGGALLLWFARGTVAAAGKQVGGALSGNNTLTKDTVYEGAGVLGTLGAGANAISGGVLEKTGSAIGGWLFDRLNPTPINTIGNL